MNIERLIKKTPDSEVIIGRYNSDDFPFSNKILFKDNKNLSLNSNKFFHILTK